MRLLSALSILVLGFVQTAAADPYTITKINYPGTRTLSAAGINDSGEIVGEYGPDYYHV